jgi:uncharacterized protein (DUF1501 family)
MRHSLTRRKMLVSLGLGTGAFMLRELGGLSAAKADGEPLSEMPLLVFAYFSGGWDTLMSLDPRSQMQFGNPDGDIYAGYDVLAQNDTAIAQVMSETGGTGLVQPNGSAIEFGPAMGKLADDWADLCVVRGVNMGTLTHEVGRRYFITGKFPRGLQASGSALPTWIASKDPSAAAIPNLVVGGVESYNEGLDPKASALKINDNDDLSVVLQPIDPTLTLPAEVDDALLAYQSVDHCIHRQLDAGGMIAAHRAAYEKARIFQQGTLWQHFDFKANPAPEILEAYEHFGINPANPTLDLAGPKGQALIAAQALTQGVCQVVSIQPASGLDSHDDDWETLHAPRQRAAFDSLSDLIAWLKLKTDPNGAPFWDRTVLVCFSEFARGPNVNVRGGRDHHLASSCLVAGKGIKGNTIVGATTDDTYAAQPVNLADGTVDEGGVVVRPADVHATVCQALGLTHEHISNQEPKIIEAMLKP